MVYKVRFIQKFQPNKQKEFMELEKMFIQLEQEIEGFPNGKRFMAYSGREPVNTLIWECEFPTLEQAESALSFVENHPRHEELYQKQAHYLIESHVEIYKLLQL